MLILHSNTPILYQNDFMLPNLIFSNFSRSLRLLFSLETKKAADSSKLISPLLYYLCYSSFLVSSLMPLLRSAKYFFYCGAVKDPYIYLGNVVKEIMSDTGKPAK